MKTYAASVILLALSTFCGSCALSAKETKIAVELRKTTDGFLYSVKNVSSEDVSVPKIFLTKPEETGYWIFLYDPSTKEIEYAWSSGVGSPEMMIRAIPHETLKAGEVIEATYSEGYIRSIFQGFSSGKCFYLMGKYKKEMLESETSKPLRICN